MLVRFGIRLNKYWFSIGDEEQKFRFNSRIFEPLKRWKLSPIDLGDVAGKTTPAPRR